MRRGRLVAVAIVVAAACASAGKDNGGGGNPDGKQADARIDSSGGGGTDSSVTTDAPMIDGAPVAVNLSQSTNGTSIGSDKSVACGNGTETRENSWYRVFKLTDHNITGGLHVTAVTFGVQEASGAPQVQVKIGTYSGNITPPPATLDTALITPITATTFTVPNTVATSATTVTVPISANVPALSQMIIEIFSPDYVGMARYFYLGGNAAGESKPAYLRAPTCNELQPKTTAALGFATSNLVITVDGTH